MNAKCCLICFFDFKNGFGRCGILGFSFCYISLYPVFTCICRHFAITCRTIVSIRCLNSAGFICKIFVGYHSASCISCYSRSIGTFSISPVRKAYCKFRCGFFLKNRLYRYIAVRHSEFIICTYL